MMSGFRQIRKSLQLWYNLMQFDMATEQTELTGRKSIEYRNKLSRARGGILILGAPLVLRHGSVHDIAGIIGITRREASSLTARMRRTGELPSLTPQALHDIKVESYKPKPDRDTPEYNAQQTRFALVKRLLEAGLIDRETTYWDRVHQIFGEGYNKPMLEDFASWFRREAFLKVREQFIRGDRNPLSLFEDAIEKTDPALFEDPNVRKEHEFIRRATQSSASQAAKQKGVAFAIPPEGGVIEIVSAPVI